jgi:hypothetical protein
VGDFNFFKRRNFNGQKTMRKCSPSLVIKEMQIKPLPHGRGLIMCCYFVGILKFGYMAPK